MAVTIVQLWLPIVAAGVLCWVASSLVHMLFKYHNADYKPLPNEDDVSQVMRSANLEPALYTMPYCVDMKEMGEEAMQKKFAAGPVAMISVMPSGMPPMGKLLGQQIAFFLIGSLLLAHLLSFSLTAGASYLSVFHPAFLAAFLAYGWATIPFSIWMGQPWSNCFRYLLDAVIYAATTAGTFAWLWPEIA